MNPKPIFITILTLVVVTSAACGLSSTVVPTDTALPPTAAPTETDLPTATDTAIPTDTPLPTATPLPTDTPTRTPTATDTPIPSPVPTNTPIATPTEAPPAVPAGWRGYETAKFFIALPEEWETIDVDKEGIEAIMNVLRGLNAEWAQNLINTFSNEAIQEALKFWAKDIQPAGTGYASANVTYQAMPYSISRDDLCIQLPAAYQQMGLDLLDTQCDLEINGLEAASFTNRLSAGVLAIKQVQYIFVNQKDLWSVTLAVDETAWEQYLNTFEGIAESFQVKE